MLESEGEPESTLGTCGVLTLLCRSAPAGGWGGQGDFSPGSSTQSLVSEDVRAQRKNVEIIKLKHRREGCAFGKELSLNSRDDDTILYRGGGFFHFLRQQGSRWTRAGSRTEKIALSLSPHQRTKDRIPLVPRVLKGGA